jgi:hypothetical protein
MYACIRTDKSHIPPSMPTFYLFILFFILFSSHKFMFGRFSSFEHRTTVINIAETEWTNKGGKAWEWEMKTQFHWKRNISNFIFNSSCCVIQNKHFYSHSLYTKTHPLHYSVEIGVRVWDMITAQKNTLWPFIMLFSRKKNETFLLSYVYHHPESSSLLLLLLLLLFFILLWLETFFIHSCGSSS